MEGEGGRERRVSEQPQHQPTIIITTNLFPNFQKIKQPFDRRRLGGKGLREKESSSKERGEETLRTKINTRKFTDIQVTLGGNRGGRGRERRERISEDWRKGQKEKGKGSEGERTFSSTSKMGEELF